MVIAPTLDRSAARRILGTLYPDQPFVSATGSAPRSAATGSLTEELLAHEDPIITGLGAASRLFVTGRSVEALILHHRLTRVEPDFVIAAAQSLRLCECEQPPAPP